MKIFENLSMQACLYAFFENICMHVFMCGGAGGLRRHESTTGNLSNKCFGQILTPVSFKGSAMFVLRVQFPGKWVGGRVLRFVK